LDDTVRTFSVHALNDSVGSPSGIESSMRLDFSELMIFANSPVGHRPSDIEVGKLSKVRFEDPEMQSCSICLEAFQQGILLTKLQCNHVFHVSCLTEWIQRSTQCPNCRAAVAPA
jgi:hypothetical protein